MEFKITKHENIDTTQTEKFSNSDIKKIKERGFFAIVDAENGLSSITVYSKDRRTLSNNMPILDNFGFDIDKEIEYEITNSDISFFAKRYYISKDLSSQLKTSKNNIEDTIEACISGDIKNSHLNSLSFLENLDINKIRLISAISTYAKQLIPYLNENIICHTLIKYHQITKLLIELFITKFDPDAKNRTQNLKKLQEQIEELKKDIENINEDRVVAIVYKIILASVRTNLFLHEEIFAKNALSIKIEVHELLEYLSGVQPRIETFIFHKEFAGVHLRRNFVSRGGLRWSDRYDDFRSEVRLLMQAQRQKNSIIIPTGAKGGFIIYDTKDLSKERFKCIYSMYIEALLDIVDNRDESGIIRDEKIINYDKDDPYLVVAADKGTSAMSDVANSIAIERGFWLKDAFASGGSKGYNHKEMGITAKSAIKSSERFFIEDKINFQKESITVAGIGSPAGDVFGNGMLLSQKFALVCAISSKEIFIDPTPDVEKAFTERKRLFDKNLGWRDYNQELLSQGGGIFHKKDKEIALSPEAKKLLGVKKDVINGEELARAVLCAKVDMLFNGGVGTYVRGVDENDSEIGDKPNEPFRVISKEIKAKVVCEGGNLGFTQKARIEFAKRGGKINCDSIDNSGGVQTSDYEVNLKIILNSLVDKTVIEESERLEILNSLIPTVENRVLWTSYFQALSISLDEIRSKNELQKFIDTIFVLEESVDSFTRRDFEIPFSDEFSNALTINKTLSRPLLAVLLSYTKIFLKSFLLNEGKFIDSEFAQNYLHKFFPKQFSTLYEKHIAKHPLKKEIIATFIADKIINIQGVTFISDFNTLGKEKFLLKIRAFLAVNELISANDIRFEIFRQDYNILCKKQYDLLFELDEVVRFLIYWVIENEEQNLSLFDFLPEHKIALSGFLDSVDEKNIKNIVGVENQKLNRFFSMLDYMQMSLTMINIKESTHQEFIDVANLFFSVTKDLNIIYLLDRIKELEADNIWKERLKEGLEKDIFNSIFTIIKNIMSFKRKTESIDEAYSAFKDVKKERFNNFLKDISELKNIQNLSFIPLSVILTSLKEIADSE